MSDKRKVQAWIPWDLYEQIRVLAEEGRRPITMQLQIVLERGLQATDGSR